jgi:hypothetical protein
VTFAALRVGIGFGIGYTVGKRMGDNIVLCLEAITDIIDKRIGPLS